MSHIKGTATRSPKREIGDAAFVKTLEQVAEMLKAKTWADATGEHFVALYADLYFRVYGMLPADLGPKERAYAAAEADELLKEHFGGDRHMMAEFLAWAWARENGREHWRRENGRDGGSISWKLQFGIVLLQEYKLHCARNGKPLPIQGDGPEAEPRPEEQAAEPPPFNHTDSGNARRFAHEHGRDVRFVTTWGKWLSWSGSCWEPDHCDVKMQARAAETTRAMYAEAAAEPVEVLRKQLFDWARKSESRGRRGAMIDLAKSEPGLAITHDALDRDHWTLPAANGTIELRTGELREHRREDLCTRTIPIDYRPDATCPRWDQFLFRIMGGDAELVAFLRRAVGYCLTGSVREHVLFFLHGEGQNGKSTFCKVLLDLLGAYGAQGAPSLLLDKKHDAHPTDQAMIFGSRVVVCQEVERNREWAEATMKQLTGGDPVTARKMNENFWTYSPTFKIWVAANNRPKVRNDDHAMWRRMRLVPFAIIIPEQERDRELDSKLRDELPGILAWAVRGCLEWQERGLSVPRAVENATTDYRLSEDVVARFLNERCVLSDAGRVQSSILYQAYAKWCADTGERPEPQKDFSDRLRKKNLVLKPTKKANFWLGLALRVDDDDGSSFGELFASRAVEPS